MKIKRLLGQRLSGAKMRMAFLVGLILWGAGAPLQAWVVTADADPSFAGSVSVTALSTTNQFQLRASFNPNYAFKEWVFYDSVSYLPAFTSTSSTTRISVTNDVTGAQAVFVSTIPQYNLTVVKGAGGLSTSPTGTTSWASGSVKTISAMPSNAIPNLFVFDQWIGDIAGIASTVSNNTTITMDDNKVIEATFKQKFTYTGYNPAGPSSGTLATNILQGMPFTAQPSQNPVAGPSTGLRYACNGWTDGAGEIPATGVSPSYAIGAVGASSSNRWTWTNEFNLTVDAQVGYNIVSYLGANNWFSQGQSVTLSASAKAGYEFLGWEVNATNSQPAGSLTLTMNGPTYVVAQFSLLGSDSDGDGLPDKWEKEFGLNASSAAGNDGANGDPDRDGLNNLEEFGIQMTNRNWKANPLNADTDADGLDDGYERYKVDPTNTPGQTVTTKDTVYATLDDGRLDKDNGTTGNRDGDCHWSTVSGYQLKADKLTNIDEWRGPDGRDPVIYTNSVFGDALYPFATDRGTVKMMVSNAAPYNAITPDTGDQSAGNASDTDGDKIDDGYEWSWDKWQQDNSGSNEVYMIGCTNMIGLYITNTVPVWTNSRYFNPGQPVGNYGGSDPDSDVLYDYKTGKVALDWYTTLREYNAWQPTAFSPTIGGAPHSIRMDLPPPDDIAPQRSSHPFLIDVDKDGLPDGYEVIFGYDPWAKVTPGNLFVDGLDNPDSDWMARSNPTNFVALRNYEVYLASGFDPRVAVDETYPKCPKPDSVLGKGTLSSTNTVKYCNREEMWGPDGVMAMAPGAENDDATNPFNYDSDGDGIWDGWENYVGLNPNLETDARLDTDPGTEPGDKLSNLAEFQSYYTSSTNRDALIPVVGWLNKIFPTDPNNRDTDGDGVEDGAEKTYFNGTSSVLLGGSVTNMVINEDGDLVQKVFAAGVWSGKCYTSGGLNPTSSDTDQDTLPDPYEACYATGLDGTVGDASNDPDGDRLKNYQEYYSCAIYHWQYDAWTYGQPSYNSADFFQGTPKGWDWAQVKYIPLFSPLKKISVFAYAGCRPTMVDSDGDNMDDYYEIYHGLNPAYGVFDLIGQRTVNNQLVYTAPQVADYRLLPYVAGTPEADPDGDGLPNTEEAPLWYYQKQSPRYHTDPSPLWMTDTGSASSWVNLYYRPSAAVWPWSGKNQPPIYAYDFESNEGFDTDGDGRSDYEELNVTKTDPMSPERPVKRRALYLPDGQDAYARTFPGYVPGVTYPKSGYVPGTTVIGYSGDYLRSFTVEAWVRPLTPSNGTDQVVVERPIMLPSGNPMSLVQGIRLNFRIALNADGYPYASYNGNGTQLIFPEARVTGSAKLSATNWTHIAATYQVPDTINPLVGGVFTLYVDGRIARQDIFRELPANGVFNPAWHIYGAPIMVGAADANPDGVIGAGSAPQPEKFFKGWIDEVRIWDGVRDGAQILAGSKIRMKQADVLASKQSPVSLFYLYSFDALTDPDHSATTTGTGVGFDSTATAIFPSGWTVDFWGASSQHSQIYSDYRMVPWIQNAAAHTPEMPVTDIGSTNGYVSLMNGTNVVGQYANFWNSSNPYGYRYYTAPDDVLDFYDVANDLLPLRWAQADEDVPMWDNGTVPATTGFDSDGDGMPDSWEELYGLDPFDPNGVNGAYGDADHDGLANLAEYLAGSSPVTWDSLGMGFSDYDNRANAGSRTFGELYDDGDGMPGSWEALYVPGLDPGKYDADKDPDGDGWSNYAEYMGSWKAYMTMSLSNGVGFVSNTNNAVMVSHCDPLDPDRYPVPLIAFNVKYNGKLGASLNDALTGNRDVRIMVYNTPAMDGYPNATLNLKEDADNDGIPDWWNKRYNVTGSAGDPDGDFLSNFDEYRYGMDPYNPDSNGNGILDGTDYSHSANQSGAVVREFTTGHVREGNNYFFAYLDVNGDKQWQPDTEPAGIGQFQPVNLGWSDVNNVEIGLTDSMQGYPRFSWPAVAGVTSYILTNSVMGIGKTIAGPRNYWHEGDWLSAGTYGAPVGTVVFVAYANNLTTYITNVVSMVTSGTLGTPSIVTPYDSYLTLARNEIEFKVDPNATSYRVQVALSNNATPILSVTNIAPFRDINGVSKAALPFYAGDNYVPVGGTYPSSVWANGRYWVRVQAATPVASVSSPWSAFNLDVQPPPAKSMINGDVYYFGKVSHGYGAGMTTNKLTILVQAFESPGFSGVADGQVQITTNCSNSTIGPSIVGNTNNVGIAKKGDFSLIGLMNKVYYVRAFIDVNGNRQLDSWEPVGYARVNAASTDYDLLAVDLKGEVGKLATGVRVIIRDRDTDADKLPDGWEWMYYGTLAKGSGDTGVQNMTYWGPTNMTLLRCYEVDPVDVDPTAVEGDTDGDGVCDFDEVCYSDRIAGTSPDVNRYDPYPVSATSLGTDLNPMKWDTDGDGLSDGYELDHGLNPLDPGDGAAEIARASAAGETIPGMPRVSRIAAVPPEGGQFSLTWQAQSGMNYEVQYSDDLKTWVSALGLGVSSYANGVYTYVDQSPKVTIRFYRVVVR